MRDELKIKELVQRGAMFVVNHSGGKDSQAQLIVLRRVVPAAQLVIVHADLGDVEWPDTQKHVRQYADETPVHVVKAVYKDGSEKGLIDLMIKNLDVPGASTRFCTSELKSGPIEKWIRSAGYQLVVSCLGIRGAESCDREKGLDKKSFDQTGIATTLKLHADLSKAGREVYEWLPIFDMSTEEVFETIAAAGQEPHWAYKAGMTRLSCSFCVFGSAGDLTKAAQHRADLYARYCALEKYLGRPLHISKRTLPEITGQTPDAAQTEAAHQGHIATRDSLVARGLERKRRTA